MCFSMTDSHEEHHCNTCKRDFDLGTDECRSCFMDTSIDCGDGWRWEGR